MKNYITIFFLFFTSLSFGQIDSLILIHDQLEAKDIVKNEIVQGQEQVITASRSLKSLKDLPFTIHVISKEEIRKYGYTTLVDVLKMLPGIKVSQPGSALEGETFLMRGLFGNANTKILLNGNPIRPSVVSGMPIGAQIPIRQAERIEVIYGPAAALYGADASAGIINIILEETERPIYTTANLSLGSRGFSNLDLSFGGKLYKDKNTVRYSLFGSFTLFNDHRIYSDPTIYNVDNYEPDALVNATSQPNYVGDENGVVFSNMPHLSRLIGGNISWRALKFSTELMYRRDHSSLGLSPVAVAYANPLNFTGERIWNNNLTIGKAKKRFSYQVKLSYLQYLMDNQSSQTHVKNILTKQLERFDYTESIDNNGVLDTAQFNALNTTHYNQYFSGTRFSYAESHDFALDVVFNFSPIKNIEITLGGILRLGTGTPITRYSKVPFDQTFFDGNDNTPFDRTLVPFRKRETTDGNLNSFLQLYWTTKRFSLVGGLQQIFAGGSSFDLPIAINPRIAFIFNLNKNLSLRGFYGKAIRIPPMFYYTSNYQINPFQPSQILQRALYDFESERTTTFELGTRWIPNKKIRADIVWFHSRTDNLISFDQFTNNPNNPEPIQGYRNNSFSFLELSGIQADINFQDIISKRVDFGFNATFHRGEEIIPVSGNPQGVRLDEIREYPNFIGKARVIIRSSENLTFTFDNIFMTSSYNRLYNPNDQSNFERPKLPQAYTLDIIGNYRLSGNFTGFFRLNNFFNNNIYAGINATGTEDDLLYNPQEGRTFRMGITYSIN